MLISVIIPAYNAESYLSRSVESVCAQTHEDLELILIDDGSTDQTRAIVDSLASKDSRIKVIHQSNRGVSFARNRGIEEAQGEFIQFLDADDTMEPASLRTLLTAAKKDNSDFAMSAHHRLMYDADGIRSKKVQRIAQPGTFNQTTFLARFEECGYLVYVGWEYCWDKLFRASFLRKINAQFPPLMKLCEDRMFMLHCLQHTQRAVVISDALYNHFLPVNASIHPSESTVFEHSRWQAHQDSFTKLIELLAEKDALSNAVHTGIARDYLNTMVVAIYRYCHNAASLPPDTLLRYIGEITQHPMMREALRLYRRSTPAEDVYMPWLLRLGNARLLRYYATRKAKGIYGERNQ